MSYIYNPSLSLEFPRFSTSDLAPARCAHVVSRANLFCNWRRTGSVSDIFIISRSPHARLFNYVARPDKATKARPGSNTRQQGCSSVNFHRNRIRNGTLRPPIRAISQVPYAFRDSEAPKTVMSDSWMRKSNRQIPQEAIPVCPKISWRRDREQTEQETRVPAATSHGPHEM